MGEITRESPLYLDAAGLAYRFFLSLVPEQSQHI